MIITTQPGAEDSVGMEADSAENDVMEEESSGEEKRERGDEEESEGSGRSDSQQGTKLRRNAGSTEAILSLLVPLAGVVVKQKLELFEILTGFETKNHYDIRSLTGTSLYRASEKSSCCCRKCWGKNRGFQMSITDHSGKEHARLRRPCRCSCCDCTLCASCICIRDWIDVEAPRGNPIGRVKTRSGTTLNFNVEDDSNRFAYIKGPSCCGFGCCTKCFRNKNFKVYSQRDRSQIGMITKQFGGVIKEAVSDADTFRVAFPPTLPVTSKMILIAAVFLIDFIAFEDN
ncbi:hypothetical protein V3C99_005428 [Haemonchus contortus]